VTVCPAKATYRREDGIIVQDLENASGANIVSSPALMEHEVSIAESKRRGIHRPDLPPDRNVWANGHFRPDPRRRLKVHLLLPQDRSGHKRRQEDREEVVPALR